MNNWITKQKIVPDLLDVVRAAGEAIIALYDLNSGAMAFREKADASPVTAADLASNRVLTESLQRITPGVPVVSEEDEASLPARLGHAPYWLIDPLDGTKEYLSRTGDFTVNLALIEEQYPVWGCVYAPALDQMYWGSKNDGAFRTTGGVTTELKVRDTPLSSSLRVIASRSHMDPQTKSFIERLGTTQLVQAGSSLKFCRIAEGEADIYPRMGRTCEWDTAAAQAVLEAAGGQVTDIHGVRIKYSKADIYNPYFVATRPDIAWS